jgi:DDE family transposase
LREEIFSEDNKEKYKKAEKDFSRKRVLTFARVVVMILSGHKMSLQNALNKLFSSLGELFSVPTASAYCQAKKKVEPEMFVHLSKVLCEDFYALYGADEEVKGWHGRRLLGGDGTYLNLPDTPELRAQFSVHENQHPGDKSQQVQALGVVLHDLLNDLGVASALAPSHSAEKSLLLEGVWSATQSGDVLVFDRNSADYTIIAKANKDGLDVIIRCPRQSFSVVNDFFKSAELERLVRLGVPQSAKTHRYVKEHELAEEIEVRLLKFKLENGEEEVLLTTLCDQLEYPRQEFYEVYGWRWRDETFYDRIKNIFELERFSGESETSIKQDFYGVIFLANLESVLSRGREEELQEEAQERQTQSLPQVNHAVSYVALVGRVANLLADPKCSIGETLKELNHLFAQNPTRKRDGRKFERKTLTHARKLRYHRYSKRVIA